MKHIQPKTLQIMVAILSTRKFSQRGLWRLCNKKQSVSIGHVNKVVLDLQRKGFVERMYRSSVSRTLEEVGLIGDDTLDKIIGKANYVLTNPLGLLQYISLMRSMDELRMFTLNVSAHEKKVIETISKKKVIFCLGTAQIQYAAYYRPDEISFYAQNPKKIYDFLKTAKKGNTKLSCYRVDYIRYHKYDDMNLTQLLDSLFARKIKSKRVTTKVQTVIDMFCDGKGVYTKPLLRNLWGVEI
jgi:hypothetical protein